MSIGGLRVLSFEELYYAYRRVALGLLARSRSGASIRDVLARRVVSSLFGSKSTKRYHYFVGSCPWGRAGPESPRPVTRSREVAELIEYMLSCGVQGREGSETLIVGARGSGKSSLQEAAALIALAEGATVIDLFGAMGGEQLGWLGYAMGVSGRGTRYLLHCYVLGDQFCLPILALKGITNPLDEADMVINVGYPPARMLIVVPDNAVVYASGLVKLAWKRGIITFTRVSNLLASDPDIVTREYNVIVVPTPFYRRRSVPNLWQTVGAIAEWLLESPPRVRTVAVLREAATLIYTRGRLVEEQKYAKSYLARFAREARHANTNILYDTQRLKGIEASVRDVVDSIVLKRMTPYTDLPQEVIRHMARLLQGSDEDTTHVERLVSNLRVDEYIAIRGNCIAIGYFAEPPNHCRAGSCTYPVLVAPASSIDTRLGEELERLEREGKAERILDPIDLGILAERIEKMDPQEILEYARENAEPVVEVSRL